MNSTQLYYPESMYKIDSEMNHEKLLSFKKNGISITGRVTRLDSQNQLLEVDLGGNLTGMMSFHDATIYDLYKEEGGLSPNIYSLVGKKIQAKIVSLDFNIIYLSRRKNMLEALKTLREQTYFEFAQILGYSKQSCFFDVGAGILGRSYGKEFSQVKFKDIQDVGVEKRDTISVKVIEFFDDEKRFELSRVDALPSHHDFFNIGDVVTCKVFGPVTKNAEKVNGRFVLIDNTFCGIVDSPYIKLEYGDKITAIIKKLTDKGLKLVASERIIDDDNDNI